MKTNLPFVSPPPLLRKSFRSAVLLAGLLTMILPLTGRAAELEASDGAVSDLFGTASLSGGTGLVGALGHGTGGNFAQGQAYLFRNLDTASGIITESIKLTASDGAANDGFGIAVSLFGNTGLVSAYRNSAGGIGFPNQGAAYLFRGLDTVPAGSAITETAKLIASDGAAFDEFGSAVSLFGSTGLIGAADHAPGGIGRRGAAYLFRGLDTAPAGSIITETAKLIASDGIAGDAFGGSVKLSGNIGLVGAHFADFGGSHDRGAAYLFRGLDTAPAGSTVTETAKLIASDGSDFNYFGLSVALSGSTGLIGARGHDSGGNDSQGAAYLFRDLNTTPAGSTITETAKLVASDGATGDWFGSGVSLSGTTGLVAAFSDNTGSATNQGSAYLFLRLDTAAAGSTITETVKIQASNAADGDHFSSSVSLDGDNFIIGAASVNDSTGHAYTGSISSLTTLDAGNTSKIISGISFISRTDWIIGENTSGNKVTLSAGDTADVTASGKGVYIGKNADAQNNTLIIEGKLNTNFVHVGGNGSTLGGSGIIDGNVVIENGGHLAAGTSPGMLTMADLTFNDLSHLDFEFGAANAPGNPLNDVVQVNGDLVLDGILNVSVSPGGTFGPGLYRMFNYTGTLTNQGVNIGSVPGAVTAGDLYVQSSVPNQINLINTQGLTLNFWDGNTPANYNNGTVNGGSGTWILNPPNDNWTDMDGTVNVPYENGQFVIFQGTPGTVTVDNSNGNITFAGAQFAVDGYTIDGGDLTASQVITIIRVGDGSANEASMTATIDANITGGTQLEKHGLGTLILNGTNTYTAGTVLKAGTLQVSADENLGAAGAPIIFNGASTLAFSADFSTNRITALNAAATFDTMNHTVTFTQEITGDGSLTKEGTGLLILTGTNTYAGLTTVNEGILALELTGSLVSDAQILINAGAAFHFRDDTSAQEAQIQVNGALGDDAYLVFGQNASAGSAGIANQLGQTRFFGDSTADSATIENHDHGFTAFLDQSQAASATIISFSGGGTGFFHEATGTADTTLSNQAGSVLDVSRLTLDGVTLGHVEGAGDIYLGSRQIRLGSQNTNAHISGIIQDGYFALAGAPLPTESTTGGRLLKEGTAILRISGANTYTGGTSINQGTLQTANLSALGSGAVALNNAVLQPLSALSIHSLDWNDGNVHLVLGPTRLNIDNAFTNGGNGGAFLLDWDQVNPLQEQYTLLTYGGASNFTNADFSGDAGFDIPNVAVQHSYQITNDAVLLKLTAQASGPLLQNSAPVLIPTFADFFVRGQVRTGEFDENNTIKSLTFDPGSNLKVYNNLTVSSGNFTVSGGKATIQGGTVLVPGVFHKYGPGALDASTDVLVAGNSFIHSGALAVNGTFATPLLHVLGGGTLMGNGTVFGNVLNNGTVAPGNSVGHLHIQGNYTQKRSGTLQIEAASASHHDVLSVSGTARLGGTLEVVSLGYNPKYGDQLPFLRAGKITGKFNHIAMPDPQVNRGRFLNLGNLGVLLVAPTSYTLVAETPNQTRVARALDRWIGIEDGDIGATTLALDLLRKEQYPQAFEAIMPGFHEAALSTALELSHSQGQMLHQQLSARRLGQRPTPPSLGQRTLAGADGKAAKSVRTVDPPLTTPASDDSRWSTWMQGSGLFSQGGLSLVPGEDFESGTFLVGADYALSEHFTVGLFASYGEGWGDYDNGGQIDLERVTFGGYATVDLGNFYLNAALGGGSVDYDIQRPIQFATLNRKARSNPDGTEFFGLLGGGYDFRKGNWTFGPQASLQYSRVSMDSFRERGADSLDLRLEDADSESLRSYLGARVAYTIALNDRVALIPEVRAFWQHEYLDGGSLNASLDGGQGPAFLYDMERNEKDALFLGAGIGLQVGPQFYANLYYNVELGREDPNHSVSLSATWKF